MDRSQYLSKSFDEFRVLFKKRYPKIDKSIGIFVRQKIIDYFREDPSEPMTPLAIDFLNLIFTMDEIKHPHLDLKNFVKYITLGVIVAAFDLKREYDSIAYQIPRLIVLEMSKRVPEEKIVQILKGFSASISSVGWIVMKEKDSKDKIRKIFDGMMEGYQGLQISGKKKEIWLRASFNFWSAWFDALWTFSFVDGFWPLARR